MQVMPVGVAGIYQALTAAGTCCQQAKATSGQIPDQLLFVPGQQGERADEGLGIVVGRTTTADRLLMQQPLLGLVQWLKLIAADPAAERASKVDAADFDLG